jgi:hypothetical protein
MRKSELVGFLKTLDSANEAIARADAVFEKGAKGNPALARHDLGERGKLRGGHLVTRQNRRRGRAALYLRKDAHDVSGEARDENGRWTSSGASVESAASATMRNLPAAAAPHRSTVRDAIARSYRAARSHLLRLAALNDKYKYQTPRSAMPTILTNVKSAKVAPVRGTGGLHFEVQHQTNQGETLTHSFQLHPDDLDRASNTLLTGANATRPYAPTVSQRLGQVGDAADSLATGVHALNGVLRAAGVPEVPPSSSGIRKSASGFDPQTDGRRVGVLSGAIYR